MLSAVLLGNFGGKKIYYFQVLELTWHTGATQRGWAGTGPGNWEQG